jgi:hypothetical protein
MTYTYADYEQAKREWLARHPNCTPVQYQRACLAIAKRMKMG